MRQEIILKTWKQLDPSLSAFQAVIKSFATGLAYQIHRLTKISSQYDETVSNLFAKLFKSTWVQMKAHFFSSVNQATSFKFHGIFTLECDTRIIYERLGIYFPPLSADENLRGKLVSGMRAGTKCFSKITSVRIGNNQSRKRLRSHPQSVEWILNLFATYKPMATYEVAVLRYMQQPNIAQLKQVLAPL